MTSPMLPGGSTDINHLSLEILDISCISSDNSGDLSTSIIEAPNIEAPNKMAGFIYVDDCSSEKCIQEVLKKLNEEPTFSFLKKNVAPEGPGKVEGVSSVEKPKISNITITNAVKAIESIYETSLGALAAKVAYLEKRGSKEIRGNDLSLEVSKDESSSNPSFSSSNPSFSENSEESDNGVYDALNDKIVLIEKKVEQFAEIAADLLLVKSAEQTGFNVFNGDGFVSFIKGHANINQEDSRTVLLYLKNQLLNAFFNRIAFLKKVKSSIESDKEEIVREFLSQEERKLAHLDTITFNLAPSEGETHNGGQLPVKVSFEKADKKKLFDIYFKPRDARVDIAVIEAFDKLNRAKLDDSHKLPVYKILNKKEGDNMYSLWEFINGSHPSDAADQSSVYLPQVIAIERVCQYLEISDLHKNNVLWDSKAERFIPIDLESIQHGAATGLLKNPQSHQIPKLEDLEIEILKPFKEKIGKLPHRYVPLATAPFLEGLAQFRMVHDIINQIGDKMIRDGYNRLSVSLKERVVRDLSQGDVPYFLAFNNCVYYGCNVLDENIIAKKSVI